MSLEAFRISEAFRAQHPRVSDVFHPNWGKIAASHSCSGQVQRNQRLASEGIEGNKVGDVTPYCCAVKLWFQLMAQLICQQIDDPIFVFLL